MVDSQFPPHPSSWPSPGGGRRWVPLEPPPPRPPDAVIIPEGQLAEILPDGLVEALEEEEGEGVALDPRWRAARDAFVASMGTRFGWVILQELGRAIARRRDGAQESAKDMCQKVLLVMSRRYAEHVAETGEAWTPDNPGAYLRGVSQNVARDHFKEKERRPAIERGVALDEKPDAAPNPEEAASHVELLAIFEHERRKLTTEEAEVFEGRVSHGMTFPAIAAVLERPVSTVQTQFARAVAKLQAIVARESGEPPAGPAIDARDARDAGARRRV